VVPIEWFVGGFMPVIMRTHQNLSRYVMAKLRFTLNNRITENNIEHRPSLCLNLQKSVELSTKTTQKCIISYLRTPKPAHTHSENQHISKPRLLAWVSAKISELSTKTTQDAS
jgi:hypothetical protein